MSHTESKMIGASSSMATPSWRHRRLPPRAQVAAASVAMLALAGVLWLATPDRWSSIEPGGVWAVLVVMALFGIAEYTVFNVQFRHEAISFALTEIPMAFGLIFLDPMLTLAARLPLSVLVLVVPRRNRGLKLAFNLSIYALETMVAAFLFRQLVSVGDEFSARTVTAAALGLGVVAPLTTVLIAFAISRFEGRFLSRAAADLRATWWMYVINAVLAAMTVSMALWSPWLSILALIPPIGIWYVLHDHGELAQELRDLDAVHGFAGRIGRTLDVDEIGNLAVDEIAQTLRAEGVVLARIETGRVVEHRVGELTIDTSGLPTSTGWSVLFEEGGVQIVQAARWRDLGIVVDPSIRELIVAPLVDESGRLGVVVVGRRDLQRLRFDESDVARLQNLAEQLTVGLRRGMLHERIEFEARHDALTGLPSRTFFESTVAAMLATRSPSTVAYVLMLDLDRFKEVNDTLGHHAGDELLVKFAERMRNLLQPGDVLARLAGDEFAMLCERKTLDTAIEFARTCAHEGSSPITIDGLEIVVTVSIGVAQVLSTDTDATQPMRRADIAMYNAKWQRTRVEHYRDEIDRRTPARLSMLGDLRWAIEHDELNVVYQPKIDLVSGSVIGAEALLRWTHPTRGAVPPTEFVRVAEDTGLIKELTDLVLAQGVDLLRRCHAEGIPLGLAINLSTHDLFDARLPDRVRTYLSTRQVGADSLTLEITESSLFVDAPRTRATIDDLHGVGIRLAIDDFGTGYSSLSYLRRLPVQELKIDQTFVAGLLVDQHDEVIVRSTIDLGHNLGLKVVAEGVESVAIMERLAAFGCDIAQGYAIARPMSADELLGWVARVDSIRLHADLAGRPPTSWVGAIPS